MTATMRPKAQANDLSKLLNQIFGTDRFPVPVEDVALQYSQQRFRETPIAKVQGEELDGFDGMLAANKKRDKWMILYNSAVSSEGRKRFTVAHEFGHYLLHRHQQEEFACGPGDIETSGEGKGSRDIEKEADDFATTLLMPLDDFRRQVGGETVSFELLGHCADRYGVSLTAAAIRWLEIAPERAVLVASRDDHMLWATSNEDAFNSGAYFATRKNTIELPRSALAHSRNCTGKPQLRRTQARLWFPREPDEMPITEMTKVAGNYGYTLTLLVMPAAERRWRRDEEEEPVEDSYDRLTARRGSP
jgi:Zn-dependent peptidase ImmA (M78 family)